MRQECQNKRENEKDCPCDETYCERHGVCCLCIRYHNSRGSKPACMR